MLTECEILERDRLMSATDQTDEVESNISAVSMRHPVVHPTTNQPAEPAIM
ncbi:MAG: hypothetical protein LC791_03975 [Acidobacteria bacterium]|nr:hypothetical protein [Acidobacteriota bacterium]